MNKRMVLIRKSVKADLAVTLFFVIFVALVSSASVPAIRLPVECETLSSRQVKDALGEPVECAKASAGAICFKTKDASVIARFNAQGFAESLFLFTSNGMAKVGGVLNQIVPDNYRGKLSKHDGKSGRGACQKRYVDEYECLSIRYMEENCMGSAPATIEVVWKKAPNAGETSR